MQNKSETIGACINTKESGRISRREFIKISGFLVGGLAIGSTMLSPGCGYSAAPQIQNNCYMFREDKVIVMLDRVPQLSSVGNAVSIMHDNERISIIIIRSKQDDYTVASNQCTHRERPLGYDSETKLLVCNSGKSMFELDGSIVRGPAEKPLQIYRWDINQSNLTIDLLNESL